MYAGTTSCPLDGLTYLRRTTDFVQLAQALTGTRQILPVVLAFVTSAGRGKPLYFERGAVPAVGRKHRLRRLRVSGKESERLSLSRGV